MGCRSTSASLENSSEMGGILSRGTVQPLHIETPLVEFRPLSALSGKTVCLKMEAVQPPGSFKIRGIGLAARNTPGRRYALHLYRQEAMQVLPSPTPVAICRCWCLQQCRKRPRAMRSARRRGREFSLFIDDGRDVPIACRCRFLLVKPRHATGSRRLRC